MVDADTQDVAEPGSGDEAMSAAGRGRPGGSVGWTSAVITVAVAGLLLFNAQSMRAWTETQAPGSLTLAARSFAESWWETTSQLGLTVPRSAVAELWAAAQAARWPAGAGAPAAQAPL